MLDPEFGVPMERFEGKLDFYQDPQHRGDFKGFVRISPNLFKRRKDGEVVLSALPDDERSQQLKIP